MLQPTTPRVTIPNKWSNSYNVKINDHINLPDMLWWKQFHSHELNHLIQIALQQNNNLNLALAKIDIAQSKLDELKLSWLPGMSILAGYSQFPVLGNPGAFVIAAPIYVLNIFQLYKQQQGAKAIVKASNHAKDFARLTIIAQVSASFFTLIAQQEAFKLYGHLIQNYHSQIKLAQSNYGFGLTAQDTIVQLQSDLQQIKSQKDLVKHNIVVSKNTLHYLLNENPGTMVVNTSFKHLNSNALIPDNLPLNVLNNRPDVGEAQSLLHAAHANVGAVEGALFPSATLGAYLGDGSYINGPINLTEGYLSAPAIDLPLLAQIRGSKAQYRLACIKYVDAIRRALHDIENDFSAYHAYSLQLRNNTSAYNHLKQHCHWVEIRNRHGIDNQIDVLACNIKLNQFELILNQNKLDKMLVLVKLYQDLAGGYHGV